MATTLQLNFALAPLPTGVALDASGYALQVVQNLSATVSGNILQGQTGGLEPSTNLGPWFDGIQWEFWQPSISEYAPLNTLTYNSVVNGQMTINQRVNSVTNITDNTYTVDRFKARTTLTTGKVTVGQSAVSLPATAFYPKTLFALTATVTTPQPTLGATEKFLLQQPVIVDRALPLIGNPTNLSLVIVASITGTFYVSIQSQDLTWSYIAPCVIPVANVPTRFEFNDIASFPGTSANFGGTTWNNASYLINVCLGAGANFNTGVANIWNVGNLLCFSDQANLFATNGATFSVTLLQHSPGIIAHPYPLLDLPSTLRDCQPYFCKSYDYGVAPGTVTTNPGIYLFALDSSDAVGQAVFPVPMISVPVVTAYSFSTGTSGKAYDVTGTTDRTVTGVLNNTTGIIDVTFSASLSAAASGYANAVGLHFTANAEL